MLAISDDFVVETNDPIVWQGTSPKYSLSALLAHLRTADMSPEERAIDIEYQRLSKLEIDWRAMLFRCCEAFTGSPVLAGAFELLGRLDERQVRNVYSDVTGRHKYDAPIHLQMHWLCYIAHTHPKEISTLPRFKA